MSSSMMAWSDISQVAGYAGCARLFSEATASTIARAANNVSPWNLCGNQPVSQHRVDGVGRPKFDFHTALERVHDAPNIKTPRVDLR